MELESILLSKISQSEKDKYHMISLVWNLGNKTKYKKRGRGEGRETERERERETERERERERNRLLTIEN